MTNAISVRTFLDGRPQRFLTSQDGVFGRVRLRLQIVRVRADNGTEEILTDDRIQNFRPGVPFPLTIPRQFAQAGRGTLILRVTVIRSSDEFRGLRTTGILKLRLRRGTPYSDQER